MRSTVSQALLLRAVNLGLPGSRFICALHCNQSVITNVHSTLGEGAGRMTTDHTRWGPKAAISKEKKQQFYKSVFVGEEEISLYDSVYVTPKPGDLSYIGKVMRLWDNVKTGEKKMRVRWYFRPQELPGSAMEFSLPLISNPKEIFISYGAAAGVENVNPVGVIERKCNVVCTSTDARNRQPTAEELESADHVFDKMWDVKQNGLVADLSAVVQELGAVKVFNKPLVEKSKPPTATPPANDPAPGAPTPTIRSPHPFASPTPAALPQPHFPSPSSTTSHPPPPASALPPATIPPHMPFPAPLGLSASPPLTQNCSGEGAAANAVVLSDPTPPSSSSVHPPPPALAGQSRGGALPPPVAMAAPGLFGNVTTDKGPLLPPRHMKLRGKLGRVPPALLRERMEAAPRWAKFLFKAISGRGDITAPIAAEAGSEAGIAGRVAWPGGAAWGQRPGGTLSLDELIHVLNEAILRPNGMAEDLSLLQAHIPSKSGDTPPEIDKAGAKEAGPVANDTMQSPSEKASDDPASATALL